MSSAFLLPPQGAVPPMSLDGALHGPHSLHDTPLLMEKLIGDCFQQSMDPQALSPSRLAYARRFHQYLAACHSHENLAFLLAIFRYEHFYRRQHTGHLPPPSLMLDRYLESVRQHSPRVVTDARRRSTCSFSSVSLAASDVLLAVSGVPFALEIEEASDAESFLKDAGIPLPSLQNLPLDSNTGNECSSDCLLLGDMWRHIWATFIADQAERQINLSNKTYRALVEFHESSCAAPSPALLVAAKTEVMRLIHENTYHAFTRMMRYADDSEPSSSASVSPFGSPLGTPLSAATKPESAASRARSSTPSSTGSRNEPAFPIQKSSVHASASSVLSGSSGPSVAPVAQRKRSILLHTLAGHAPAAGDLAGSPSHPLTSILSHLKSLPGSPVFARASSSAPQTPAPGVNFSSDRHLPEDDLITRPRSSAVAESHTSGSLFGKLWKKRR
ncbi:hypothetical protein METBIDRAFT_11207 [Metschnikowia bicuspidata var. bicuspidata NRRL YB-4993]|uniref:RGS domain-containing protein n=1 Tax=Metschnikowia bicuspidata var. bicuspidata NRRL YB-4993 TaxID=869754 RepID=A0A1A0HEE1_9ASCO|nr:hypothetical protein METBIDRAFT_11207 [Metschnikowia bicuspidata var. bicuspidata NRRL YB-4993]OBA22361.1 hypothetical protein METBIDRAFT_11207 [Metschnikowia bicuspidata var. bicuspidata NRRL YB-4993]